MINNNKVCKFEYICLMLDIYIFIKYIYILYSDIIEFE